MQTQAQKKFWQSTNFWFGLIAIAAAMFGMGFPENELKTVVAGIIGIIGAGNIALHYFRSLEGAKLIEQLKASLKAPGFYASIIAFLVGFLPWLPVPELNKLVEAILTGDTALILQAVVALAIVLIKILQPGLVKS